ncbi:hypothetical protein ABZZ17_33230 [Streptomyces sp. NPDC006512]|uniref:hypothetical protein n=1 Tax=Streptomyces sp. NPDC006512 TaxID=3154307 RepID=UPI0033AF5EC6
MRGIRWAGAAAAAIAAAAVAGCSAGATAADGWVPERSATAKTPARAGGDPSRAAVTAELAAAATATGMPRGEVWPLAEGELADCLADWVGSGPADERQMAALEAALTERGWQVTARRGGAVPAVALTSGAWRLEVHDGGILQRLTMVATHSGQTCREALRRQEATRGPRG